MFHDSAPGDVTGLDQWKCLGWGKECRWWRGKCGSHLGEWWCLSPHSPWFSAQQVSLGQLMAPDIQADAVILSYVPWPSSSQCCRELHYCGPILYLAADLHHSAKDKREESPRLHMLSVLPSLLSGPALVYVFHCFPSELWCRRPPDITHTWNDMCNMDKRISSKDSVD